MLLKGLPTPEAMEEKEKSKELSLPPDSAYRISAGNSVLKEIKGEKILQLEQGVKIIHGGLTITSIRGVRYAKRRITYLIGDVKITKGQLYMEGRECEYRRARDQAILRKNVKIRDRGWQIECDEAVLFRTKDKIWLKGNITAEDSTTTLEADSLYYDRGISLAEVFGRVSITNLEEGFTAKGKHGFYFRDKREGIMDRDPHLIVDPKSDQPATVDGDTMRFYPDTREALAYGRVKIIKGETITQCDSAAVFDNDKLAKLFGKPLAKQGTVSMGGGMMKLHYTGSEVDRIWIIGNAAINEKQEDSLVVGRDNWIRGDSMILYFKDNDLDSISVRGNCSSEYYPTSKSKVESNLARGDSMFFILDEDTLSYVRISGKSDGIYKYVNLKTGETCDSLRAEIDSGLVYIPFHKRAENVSYSAKRIEFLADRRDIVLHGKAKVYYQNRTLLGDDITYNSSLQLLDARGSPVLIEGSDKFYGSSMDYDLESGIGLVRDGSTRFQSGFYFGRDVAKVQDNVLKVWNSTYTTCNLKTPHYHFGSKEMKVFVRDKVVSGPIWLYIGRTPIAYLPFLANNISKDRKSGFLRPEFEFGITRSTGRFIRNFGYYWATNDYTDFKFVGDFNEDASFRVFIDNRYKLRYRFSGSVNFSFFRDLHTFSNEWTLSSTHRQNLGEKFSLNSDLRFVSSDAAPRSISRIDQVADVINRRIESRVSVRKSWNAIGFSASARRVQQLNVQDPNVVRISTDFPDISLSIPSRNLYFGKETKRGKKSFWENFLGGIRYSPRISMRRTSEVKMFESKETISQNTSLGFSSPRKIFFLNFSPRLSASNSYTRRVDEVEEHTEINSSDGTLDTTYVPSSRTVETENIFRWSTGAGLRTNFYGTFYPHFGALVGLRHTLTPSITYSFSPRVGNRPRSQAFNLSLTNSFDIKIKRDDKERKISNILIWSLSTNYNPQAPRRRGWGMIASRVNIRMFGTSISLNQTLDPYQGDVISTQITSFLGLSGHHSFGLSRGELVEELNVVARDTSSSSLERPAEKPEGLDKGSPWNLGMSFSYTKSRTGIPRSTLNLNGMFQLTRSWRIAYSTTYDVESRKFLGQNYSIYRDLHCWEMSFSRQKLGDEWQYYFKINIKAHPEVYAESGRRGLGRSSFGAPSIY